MSQPTWHTINTHSDAPTTAGVYQYWQKGKLLYIGKAVNLKARLASHAQNAKLDAKEAAIVAGDMIKYTFCDSEFKALLLESELIRQCKPPHNRVWKDDKSYLYIVIDVSDPFPRPHFARAHELNLKSRILNPKSRIFGPFPNSKIAEEVLTAIRHLIPFCMAKHVGKYPCFYSRLGLCNPCPSQINTPTGKSQYRKQIRQVVRILEGNIDPVIKELTKQMKLASSTQDFETALATRIKIERFRHFITTHSFTDRHFSYNNSVAKLASLRSILNTYYLIPNTLHRIECYDASNSGFLDSAVSLVVMTDGLLDKGQYRRFKVKNPRAHSDLDRLEEALVRRLKHKSWPLPDLVLLDGGLPQLRHLQRIFDQLPNPPPYLGLAKRPDRLIDLRGQALKAPPLLQELRDEAHRFANSYRKILEKKRTRI
ncbi:MAG: GIY-YIG nuclease family protein [bacterium]